MCHMPFAGPLLLYLQVCLCGVACGVSLLLVMALLTDIRILLQVPGRCMEGWPQEGLHLASRPQEEDH
jgi:hypothetical protein